MSMNPLRNYTVFGKKKEKKKSMKESVSPCHPSALCLDSIAKCDDNHEG